MHVTEVWAKAVEKHFTDTPTQEEVREKVQTHFAGRVRRHVLRGTDPLSARELRDAEDLDSTAGVRNPALLESRWPKLWGSMANFRRALLKLRDLEPELHGLSDCCGHDGRQPPSEEVLERGRRFLEQELGLPDGTASLKHPASPWRHGLLDCAMVMAEDTDSEA